MRDKQKRRRERTWAEAARMVLENYSDAPMTPKQILNVIEAEGLKETSGSSPLACLNTMLHSNSRTREALFYKLPGRISLFTMKKNATQWSRVVSLPEDGDTEDTAEEGSQWTEGSSVSPAIEPSCNASCSGEFPGRETRSLVQINKQKRRSGVLLPRVVLTPLKVNGAHLPSTSGSSASHVEGQSAGSRTLGSNLSLHRRAALSRDNPHHLRGIRSTPPGQMKKNNAEEIDFETPRSILVNTNLRALINVRTFNALPHNLQQQLLLLLPDVDRQVTAEGPMRMSGSALNNEFFAHACQRWRERLAEGEFTPEAQLRMKQEMDKEKKVEDWKEIFFEDFYGQKFGLSVDPLSDSDVKCVTSVSKSPIRSGQKRNTETAPKRIIPTARIRTRSVFRKEKEGHGEPPKLAEIKVNSSPEIPVLKAHTAPKDEGNLPSTSDRVPELHPETSEQKRKTSEPENASPSLEKKPRMEQRQSFRNTIQSVHPEKPQPTKEEPKVPPIRIQLSRIKPPWVDKGLPAYKICPRIIPNSDPFGCWTNTCTSIDCQTSGPQSSDSRGGGPGRGGSNLKRRTWSGTSKGRKSSKKCKRRQYSNCCRTQLLSSSALRNNQQKPAVPTVRIRWTSGVESAYFEAEKQGVTCDATCKSVMDAAFADAKDRCAAEDAVCGTLCEGGQDYKAAVTVGPRSLKTVLEGSMDVLSEAKICWNKEKNLQLGAMCRDEAAPSECIDVVKANQSSVDSCVLGDVSNTFQNKPVVAKVAKREPSDCKGDFVATAEPLQNSSPESSPIPSSANLQTSQTSLPGPLVALHTDAIELNINCENEPFINCSSTFSAAPDLQKLNATFESRLNEAQPLMTTQPTSSLGTLGYQKYGSLPNFISNSVEEPTGEETADCKSVREVFSFKTESCLETLKKQPLSDRTDRLIRSLSEQGPQPTSDAGFSSDPIHGNMHFHSGHTPDSFQLKSANVELRSPSTVPFAEVKQTLADSDPLAGPAQSTPDAFPSGNQSSKSFRKPKRQLFNKPGFSRNSYRVPLILDLPFVRFPNERGPKGQLQTERSSLSLRKNRKRSLWGKVFKGPQDLASCYFSTDVQPPGLENKYAVSGSASLSMRVIADRNGNEKVTLRCSCSLKAMSMCKGCGAFCHNDCIGPSKLCVLCLVIR